MLFRLLFTGSFFWLGFVHQSQAQQTPAFSYAECDKVFAKAAAIQSGKVVPLIFVVSSDQSVRSSDIVLTVRSHARGDLPVPVGPGGQIQSFPRDENLRREDPPVFSNQSPGTLHLSVGIGVVVPSTPTFSYSWLVQGLDEGNLIVKQQASLLSFLAPQATALVFQFAKSPGAEDAPVLTVAARETRKVYTAKAGEHSIVLPVDRSLAGNAEVTLSALPLRIVLQLH